MEFRFAPRRRVWLVLVALVAMTLTVSDVSSTAQAARTWHVSTSGSDSATGSATGPLRTLGTAVDRAVSGDTIEVAGGVYRESIQVFRKALHIRSSAGERAVLDGSRRVSGWRRSGGAYVVDGWTHQFQDDFGPMVRPDNRTAGLPDQVFVGGQPLIQVASLGALRGNTFFHDTAADELWLAQDPAGRAVDVSNQSWGIYLNEADGSRLTNLTVRRYGTERRHIAAIRAYGDNLTLVGVVVEQNAAIGISVIGRNVEVSNGRASDNGYIGIHADRATNLTVDSMSVIANNRAGFDPFHSAGGIKATTSTGVTVRNSHVAHNDGPGIWTDISSSDVSIVGNLVERNLRSGIEVELTTGASIVGNTALANRDSGIWILESDDVQVWNNAAFDNRWQIRVEEGPRRDVNGVTLRNNVVGSAGSGDELLHVNDWTENRSAAQMGVTFDHTLYWRPNGSSRTLSRVGRWPTSLAISSSVGAHRQATGQGGSSLLVSGPRPAVGAGCRDHRVPDGLMSAVPLPSSIASLLGVGPGGTRPVGPITAGPHLMYDWPLDAAAIGQAAGGTVGRDGVRRAVRNGLIPAIPAC